MTFGLDGGLEPSRRIGGLEMMIVNRVEKAEPSRRIGGLEMANLRNLDAHGPSRRIGGLENRRGVRRCE